MLNEEQPKKTHKTLNIVLGIIMLAIAIFCALRPIFIREKTKREQAAQVAIANENAVRYVREKYGFEPEIVENTKYDFITSEIYGSMCVKLRAEGREFGVVADTTKENSECLDDFQLDEINAAFLERLNEIQSGGEPVKIYFGSDKDRTIDTSYASMFRKKLDVENLDELLKNRRIELEMTFADVDFSKSELPEKLKEYGVARYRLTSFDTEEHLDEFMKLGKITDRSYELYAPYITDYTEFADGEKSKVSYKLGSFDDFQYCWFPEDHVKFKSTTHPQNVEASECDDSSFRRHFDKDYEAHAISKPLSKIYKLSDGYGETCIYYPLSKFEGTDLETVGAAWCMDVGIGNSYDIARAEVCGDHAVFTLPSGGGGKMFMLVDIADCKDFVPEWRKTENIRYGNIFVK